MPASFWPVRALQRSSFGPAWPWLRHDAPDFGTRVGGTLRAFWAQRVETVPAQWCGQRTLAEAASRMEALEDDDATGFGYELAAAAARGSADAFWFFDLGAVAWMLRLQQLRVMGAFEVAVGADLDAVEARWATDGPAAAAAELDARLATAAGARRLALMMYRLPLLLWHDRDAARTLAALDECAANLSPEAQAALGCTLPLTAALAHALAGRAAYAAHLLVDGYVAERPAAWQGLRAAEVAYHRARYLWDSGARDAALTLLAQVMRRVPSQALRLVTDATFTDASADDVQTLATTLAEWFAAAERDVRAWQAAHPDALAAQGAVPAVRRFAIAAARVDEEPIRALVAAAYLDDATRWQEMQTRLTKGLGADLAKLREFARTMPPTLPFRFGSATRPGLPLIGSVSVMADCDALMEAGELAVAAELVTDALEALPPALRMALLSYGARLVMAMATAGDVVRAAEAPEGRARFAQLQRCVNRTMALLDPINTLPDHVGASLATQLQKIWTELTAIEAEWRRADYRAVGQMRLVPAAIQRPVPRGGWAALTVSVVDSAGTSVPGVPVRWQVVAGRGRPVDGQENLSDEWTLSLETGVVYLQVALPADATEIEGELEVAILGSDTPTRLRYAVATAEA